MTIEKFREDRGVDEATIHSLARRFISNFSPGKRDLTCSAWAIPTRNIRGWKGPCYLMTDAHYSSYAELLEKVQWDEIRVSRTASRKTAVARIAWSIAATSRLASLGLQRATRRHLEEQCGSTSVPKPKPTGQRQRNCSVQRRQLRKRPSHRQEGGACRAGFVAARNA